MKYIRLIDNYSVAPTLQLNHNQTHYKSIGGGITTIIAYTLSLAYAITVLMNSLNDENMGTVSQMENPVNDSIDHIFKGTVMNIYFKKRDDSEIDPFNQTNLMFIPKVYQNSLSTIYYSNQLSQLKTQQVQVKGGYLSYSSNQTEELDLQILLTKCSEQNKLQNQTCAQESDIKEFLAYGLNTFVLEFFVHQISPKDGQLKSITKTIYLTLDVQSSQNIQITYRKTEASVDDGFFVSNERNSEYVNNLQIITLSINQDKLDSHFQDVVYVLFDLKLDSLITEVQVTFPKFGDYLSEVWAMASMILTIGEFMRILNQRFLEDEMLMGIIKNYYPQLDKIQINYNCFRRIQSVVTVDSNYDVDHFKQQMEQLKQKAQIKLNYNNLFYEISRLQLLIQSLISDRQQIYKIKGMGIPFLTADNSLVEEGNYIDEDFTILSNQLQ